ncbi:MAG: FAD:protein FMN transferase [Thermoleophilia bacterium]
MSARTMDLSFRAMGTDCMVVVTAGSADARRARRALETGRDEVLACEAALSRFDPDSDLSRLNAVAGTWAPVGERLELALAAALRARVLTGGRFDPTVLPALVAAGYDRSFERLTPGPTRDAAHWRAGAAVQIDRRAHLARIAAGAAVDLGGIAKGWAAGRAMARMANTWPGMLGGIVDLGGDMAVTGAAPSGNPWIIGVEDPRRAGTMLGTLSITGGGIATSGRNRRRFGPGRTRHHIIDPATGRPAVAGPLAVTVVAARPEDAEAHATLLSMATPEEAAAHVARHVEVSAVMVPAEGSVVVLGRAPLTPMSTRMEVAS